MFWMSVRLANWPMVICGVKNKFLVGLSIGLG